MNASVSAAERSLCGHAGRGCRWPRVLSVGHLRAGGDAKNVSSARKTENTACIQICNLQRDQSACNWKKITLFDGVIFLHFLHSESINATCEDLKSFKFY